MSQDPVLVKEAPKRIIDQAVEFLRSQLNLGVEVVSSTLRYGLVEVNVMGIDGHAYVARGYCRKCRGVRHWECLEL